jgi:L-ribulokinase
MIGMEAGQSAFGDIYAWFKEVLSWPLENILDECKWLDLAIRDRLSNEVKEKIIPELSQAAENINPQESSIIALDWMNGRRTPYANQELKGAITGLTLGSDAPKIFRALVESTAYGAKKIVERFQEEGVEIHGVIALGGVAKKSPFVMQLVADVLNMPIQVAHSEQTCALGSAMAASVVANIHPTVEEAQKAMGQGFEKVYEPNPDLAKVYEEKYVEYNRLGDYIESST